MEIKEMHEGYRRNHHNLELSFTNYRGANLVNIERYKKQMIQNIDWQVSYLNKIKKEIEHR